MAQLLDVIIMIDAFNYAWSVLKQDNLSPRPTAPWMPPPHIPSPYDEGDRDRPDRRPGPAPAPAPYQSPSPPPSPYGLPGTRNPYDNRRLPDDGMSDKDIRT